jgi:fibronectin-binding autotransporter adhesin
MKSSLSRRFSCNRTQPFRALKAAAAIAVLTGPIYAQVIPAPPTTRTWDNGGAGTAAGTFLWNEPLNWSADTLPTANDIASLSLNLTGIQTLDLGGLEHEVGALYFSVNSGANYLLSNGTIVTNSINQNQDDPNALNATAQVKTKNGGADVLNVSVSSNTLQLQAKITSAGLNKFGGTTLRLGTSGTAFDNAINGDITIYGGTLRASAGATAGVNNPLGGTGDIVIGAPNVTLQLEAQIASGEYDFVRNIRAGNNNFTLTNNNASGTDPGDPTMRIGTLFMGNATMTSASNSGFLNALDGLTMVPGSTNTRVQVNTAVLTIDNLTGDASSALYKRGGTDLQIRGNSEATFAGDIYIKESTLRLVSLNPGENPAGGADSTIYFAHGYGLAAQDGGQLLQLRSDVSMDFGSDFAFTPGVTIGRINVDRVGTTATGQTLTLGTGNISGGQLNVTGVTGTGASAYTLELDGLTINAGTTGVLNATSANTRVGALNVGAGGTLIKLGGSQLVLTGDNTATMLGSLIHRGGELHATVPGSLGNLPVTVGNTVPNTAGILTETGIVRWNASGASANATGADIVVNLASQVDLNADPIATDTFRLNAGGIIQGNATQFAGLTIGTNLTVEAGAVLGHETHASTSQITGLTNDANLFYGISATANSVLPAIGVGSPWVGISNDRSARTIAGSGGTLVPITINGGDGNMSTIEAVFQGVNGTTLSFGGNATADSYSFLSATGQTVTLAIRGIGGTSLALTPGGNVAFEDDAVSTGLAANVDKILVQSGTLLLGSNNALGGVPLEVQNGGGLDIRTGAAFDGPVTIKSGGVLWLNDNFTLSGTGGPVTIEGGGKLDLTGANAPANIFTSTQEIVFAGTGHTVRFTPSEITDLDTKVPNAGVTYVVAGGAATAVLPNTNVNVTTNTQTAGITLENGILTNDATSRGFAGPITLNNTNFTVAATRGTTLAITNGIATTGNVQVGSATAIDFRDKTPNPERVSGLGLADPYNGSPQVVFAGSFEAGGNVTATATHLAFADALTKIGGDLIFNGNALYLDGGGPLSGGSSTKGDLTARLTDTTGLVANRVANSIILGNFARSEMSIAVGSGTQTITQPFVITGKVNPIDKRTFWVDRAEAAGTVNALFTDILLKNGSEFGIDESNVGVRASLKLDGNATLVRNHDDYDLRDLSRGPAAPVNVTLTFGEPTFGWDDATDNLVNGSNATLNTTIDGTVGAGVTLDIVRSTIALEQNAVLNGIIRTQTAPARGDSFVISRSSGLTTDTTLTGTGEIQLGRSVAANGPEDFDIRATEVVTGNPAQTHTVAVPVRVVDDGAVNIDGVVRSERHNDSNVNGLAVLNTLNVDPGATVQTISSNQTRLTIGTVNLGANSGIDSTNSTSVFLGNVVGGANAVRFTGSAQARITGNVTASAINVKGAGIDFDPGFGSTSVANAPMALSGLLSVRSGTADLGTNLITGAATEMVAGLRENKTQGSFDETSANSSNEVKLGPVLAQIGQNIGWGENQTATYTGQIFIPDNGVVGDGTGSVAFAKWFDDSVKVVIDGTTYLRNTTFNDGVSSGAISLATGWHDIEIRLGQGTGGAGPVGQDGNVFNLGLGIDLTSPVSELTSAGVGVILDGSQFVAPLDNGSMNLFRTTTVKSTVSVGSDATLKAGGFSNLGGLRFNGFSGTVEIAASGAAQVSTTDSLILTGGASGTLNVARAQDSVIAGQLDLGGTLTKTGAGTLVADGGTPSFGDVVLQAGRFFMNGTMPGSVFADAGTEFGGSGSVGVVLSTGATLSPGNRTAGILSTADLTINGGTLALELNGAGPGQSDQLNVTGGVSLLANTNLTLSLGYIPAVGQTFTIINNDGLDPIANGTFRFLYGNTTLNEGSLINTPDGAQFRLSYAGGSDFNDLVLTTTIPEPGTAISLLGAIGSLLGLQRFRRRK